MEKNIIELIHNISALTYVEGIDENNLTSLKLKAIELLSAYAVEKSKSEDLWKYPIVDTPDFGAYFSTDKSTEKTSLIFRQELNNTMHYYFSSAPEIITAINHLFGEQLNNSKDSTIAK